VLYTEPTPGPENLDEAPKFMQLIKPPVTLTTSGGYQVSTAAGDQIVVQLNNVEVLRITLGATMTIKSQDNLSIEAPNITLKATNVVTIMSGANTSIKSQGQLSVQASGTLSITGATVNINGDGLVVT
jgi:hypothetical protein